MHDEWYLRQSGSIAEKERRSRPSQMEPAWVPAPLTCSHNRRTYRRGLHTDIKERKMRSDTYFDSYSTDAFSAAQAIDACLSALDGLFDLEDSFPWSRVRRLSKKG